MTLSQELYTQTFITTQKQFYESLKTYTHDDLIEYLLQINELYIPKRNELFQNYESDSFYIQMKLIQLEIKERMVTHQ